MGQYSVLFDKPLNFRAVSKTNSTILVLNQDFFVNSSELIEGLEDCIIEAEETVELEGIPYLDFKKYANKKEKIQTRLSTALKRLTKLDNSEAKNIFKDPGQERRPSVVKLKEGIAKNLRDLFANMKREPQKENSKLKT